MLVYLLVSLTAKAPGCPRYVSCHALHHSLLIDESQLVSDYCILGGPQRLFGSGGNRR